ncbi:hypothetical protein MBLNU13_g02241t1 [Cladosporium sp. NU13]
MGIPTTRGAKTPTWSPRSLDAEEFNLSRAKTPVGSPLRAFILELISHHIARNDEIFQGLVGSTCPRELFIDLLKHLESRHGLMKLLKPSTKVPKVKNKCEFHRHNEENSKCSETK